MHAAKISSRKAMKKFKLTGKALIKKIEREAKQQFPFYLSWNHNARKKLNVTIQLYNHTKQIVESEYFKTHHKDLYKNVLRDMLTGGYYLCPSP